MVWVVYSHGVVMLWLTGSSCGLCRAREDISSPGKGQHSKTALGFLLSMYCFHIVIKIVFCLFVCFVFSKASFSLCSPDCPGTCFVDQADFEITEIRVPLPLECWD